MLEQYFFFFFFLIFTFFFFNDTATTEIYTLSLHDALPIYRWQSIHATDAVTFESIDQLLSQQAFAHRMRAADIFIGTPNKTEGFYLAPLEAMASKVAVICPDVIGNRSFCLRDMTCLMPNYDDLDGHVGALLQLVDDPSLRRTIARNGYRKARSRQWWDERSDFLGFLLNMWCFYPNTPTQPV